MKLNPALTDLCGDHGRRQAAMYSSGASSTALSMLGMEKDPVGLAKARMAECYAALRFRLDPLVVLKWTKGADNGSDLKLLGQRVDVKQTGENGPYLIYPASKAHRFEQHDFDLLVLVRTNGRTGDVVGWTSKRWFRDHHQVEGPAKPGNVRGPNHLIPGTLFMPAEQLWSVEEHLDWLLDLADRRKAS